MEEMWLALQLHCYGIPVSCPDTETRDFEVYIVVYKAASPGWVVRGWVKTSSIELKYTHENHQKAQLNSTFSQVGS